MTTMLQAVEAADVELVRQLLEAPPDHQDWHRAFHKACAEGKVELLRLFLQNEHISPGIFSMDLFEHGMGPAFEINHSFGLQQAAWFKRLEAVQLLLQDGRSNPLKALRHIRSKLKTSAEHRTIAEELITAVRQRLLNANELSDLQRVEAVLKLPLEVEKAFSPQLG